MLCLMLLRTALIAAAVLVAVTFAMGLISSSSFLCFPAGLALLCLTGLSVVFYLERCFRKGSF